MSMLSLGSEIGEGVSGQVRVTSDGKYAYKRYFNDELSDCFARESVKEVAVMKALSGAPYIQTVYRSIFEAEEHGYFMPLYPYNLKERIKKSPISPYLAKRILYQILVGLYHANNKFVIHGDIKPSNILVDSDDNIVIADWGHAVINTPSALAPKTPHVQTLFYRAPEVLLHDYHYTYKIDVWSAALVYYEMLTGEPLLLGDNDFSQFFEIVKFLGLPTEETWPGVSSLPNQAHLNVPKAYVSSEKLPDTGDPILDDLLSNMLVMNPADRFSVTDALSHRFFDDIRTRDFPDLTELEKLVKLNSAPVIKSSHSRIRSPMVSWIREVCKVFQAETKTYFLAVRYIDRLVSKSKVKSPILTAAAAVFLASVIEDEFYMTIRDLVTFSGDFLDGAAICEECRSILNELNHDMYCLTLPDYTYGLAEHIRDTYDETSNILADLELINSFLSVLVGQYRYVDFDLLTLSLAVVQTLSNINEIPSLLENLHVDPSSIFGAMDFVALFKRGQLTVNYSSVL